MLVRLAKQFVGFTGTGAIATGIQYTLLLLLAEIIGVSPVLASALGYGISSVANYLMKYHWVFASEHAHRRTAPRYALISAIGLSLNTGLMALGTQHTDWHYLLVQILVTGIVLIWNFAANALWTFGAHRQQQP